MNQPNKYSLSGFVQCLKLGIWQKGYVEEWGIVEKMKVYPDGTTNAGCTVRKKTEEYLSSNSIPKAQLGIGVYLHDLYLTYSSVQGYNRTSNYIMVVSECRMKDVFEERLYHLKVTNQLKVSDFSQLISKTLSPPRRKKLWGFLGSIREKKQYHSGTLSPLRKI